MYPLALILVLRNKSSGFWAKAAMDTSTRITTAVTEIDLMTRALLGRWKQGLHRVQNHRCLDGSVMSSALQDQSVTGNQREKLFESAGHAPAKYWAGWLVF
jgi:hypothetical protein